MWQMPLGRKDLVPPVFKKMVACPYSRDCCWFQLYWTILIQTPTFPFGGSLLRMHSSKRLWKKWIIWISSSWFSYHDIALKH